MLFALIPQPFYAAVFHPTMKGFLKEITNLNIFFTLLAGAIRVQVLMNIKKYWWVLIVLVAIEILLVFDYSLYGKIMMVLFYIGRKNSALSSIMIFILMTLLNRLGDAVNLGPIHGDTQFFAILALPFIYIKRQLIQRLISIFYTFYQFHLFCIFLLSCI